MAQMFGSGLKFSNEAVSGQIDVRQPVRPRKAFGEILDAMSRHVVDRNATCCEIMGYDYSVTFSKALIGVTRAD